MKRTQKEGEEGWFHDQERIFYSWVYVWCDICFTPRHRCLWRRLMTWWPLGPSRNRCLQLTFLWFCATPWPGRNLWSSRSSFRCSHSQSFQVIKLKREEMNALETEARKEMRLICEWVNGKVERQESDLNNRCEGSDRRERRKTTEQ